MLKIDTDPGGNKVATKVKAVKKAAGKGAEVDVWFDELEHPLKAALLETRKIILAADKRIEESIKLYRSVQKELTLFT